MHSSDDFESSDEYQDSSMFPSSFMLPAYTFVPGFGFRVPGSGFSEASELQKSHIVDLQSAITVSQI